MYIHSSPIKLFYCNVEEIQANIKDANGSGCTNDTKQMIFRAAIVECSAALEEYVEQISGMWIKKLEEREAKNCSLPWELRHFILGSISKHSYAEYLLYKDEAKFIKSLKEHKTNILDDSANIIANHVVSCAIADSKYPSPGNLKKVFLRFGIDNLYDRISGVLKADARFLLQSLMDIRCSVAHSYPSGQQFTFNDVVAHLDNTKRFVGALDKVLFAYFSNFATSDCWPTD